VIFLTRRNESARSVALDGPRLYRPALVAEAERSVSGTSEHLLGVFFTGSNRGTAVGRYGTILHTADGGATWTQEFSDTRSDLFGVFFSDADTGTVVGGEGTILRTR